MFKAQVEYIGFDDRWWMWLVGIPVLTFLIPFLFFGMTWDIFVRVFPQDLIEGLVYTVVFWLTCRQVTVYFRKKYPERKQNLRRVVRTVIWICGLILPISITISLMCEFLSDTFLYEDFKPTPLQGTIATYFITFAIISLYEAVYYFKKYSEAILEKEKIQQAHIQGQLDNLRNQINPHFLFNSM
ncbi:MAG: hypothetical protein AAF705_09350, partial [Bacteroidota bacterium]